ncbi:hypothetical protein [Acinetobacter sp. YH12134]|uniref:hypothetical protein n=1 Tax=Acinetobacter sp. YH12134 TaxID=2601118 RepID=UPI0015D3EA42|nr:hypothetical protein [Acinetobacter sp. YH12134]
MEINKSLVILINYIVITPILCYLIFGLQLIFKRYSKDASVDQLLEQEKLIKDFKTKFTKSSLKQKQNLQARELLAQKIAKQPNVTGRFLAYCLQREIHNINYIMYIFNYTKDLVKVPDIEGNSCLQISETKCNIFRKGIFYPIIIGLGIILLITFFPASLSLLSLAGYLSLFILTICILLYLFPFLCTYLLGNETECIFYEKISHKKKVFNKKKCCNLQQGTKSPKFLCYLIECARSNFGCMHMSVEQILKNLEIKQMSHDDRYHKDIWVLNTQDKARHMAAHIGKYSGQILEATRSAEVNEATVQKYVIDSLIINFSYANIFLNLVSKNLDSDYLILPSLEKLTDSIGRDYLSQKGYISELKQHGLDLAMDMCILAGKILKTVESLDHVEQHDFRNNFNQYTIEIFKILITLCHIYEIKGIETLIANRLYEVEQRHVYFEVYGNYKDGYKVM